MRISKIRESLVNRLKGLGWALTECGAKGPQPTFIDTIRAMQEREWVIKVGCLEIVKRLNQSRSNDARSILLATGISNRGNNLAAYEIEKRSPFGYLSVRDKKNPRWEFRGKFVGVRGKKSTVSQAARQGQPVF